MPAKYKNRQQASNNERISTNDSVFNLHGIAFAHEKFKNFHYFTKNLFLIG